MNNVRKYTDKQLLDKVKSLDTFESIPSNYWALFVRSNEDAANLFDDKCYIFNGSKFVTVTTCTTNKGHKGTGVVEANVWNYDGYKLGLHRGKTPAGIQVKGFPYRRDFTTDGKTNPTTEIKTDIDSQEAQALQQIAKAQALNVDIEQIILRACGFLTNICTIFAAGNVEQKRKILQAVFPSGFSIEKSTSKVRTPEINSIIGLICSFSSDNTLLEIKNGAFIAENPVQGGEAGKIRTHAALLMSMMAA